VDHDDDGKIDLVAGDESGAVWFFRNVGTSSKPKLAAGIKVESNGVPISAPQNKYTVENGVYKVTETIAGSSPLAASYSKIELTDWNEDGLTDMLVGHSKGHFLLYYNTGKKGKPTFGPPSVIEPKDGSFPSRPSPHVVDWNNDGKKDLLVGCEDGQIRFYPNEGSNDKPSFDSYSSLEAGGAVIKEGIRARLDIVDWNSDGKLDVVVGNYARNKTTSNEPGGGNIWVYLQK
jgi:hypothetical protein